MADTIINAGMPPSFFLMFAESLALQQTAYHILTKDLSDAENDLWDYRRQQNQVRALRDFEKLKLINLDDEGQSHLFSWEEKLAVKRSELGLDKSE